MNIEQIITLNDQRQFVIINKYFDIVNPASLDTIAIDSCIEFDCQFQCFHNV